MEEKLITTKTLQLAKKRGFNLVQRIITVYDKDTPNESQSDEHGVTQSLLQKWLRDTHKLHITIFSSSQESWMFRITRPHQKLEEGLYGEDYNSFEEALEEGLQEGLKLIKS